MGKVTNNENMRRYVHMKLSNGGSGSGSGGSCTCPPPMIVEGTGFKDGIFTPASGSPTFAEAKAHMLAGGLVYLTIVYDGEPVVTVLVTSADPDELEGYYSGDSVIWINPDSSTPTPEPYVPGIPEA